MLAPARRAIPIQIVDVRDLAAWMMKLVESRTTGYFNAVSSPVRSRWAMVVGSSQHATPEAGTSGTWVAGGFSPRRALEVR